MQWRRMPAVTTAPRFSMIASVGLFTVAPAALKQHTKRRVAIKLSQVCSKAIKCQREIGGETGNRSAPTLSSIIGRWASAEGRIGSCSGLERRTSNIYMPIGRLSVTGSGLGRVLDLH